MNIFRRPGEKWKQSPNSDNLDIVLKTERKLSKKQKNAIITIVKDGIKSNECLHSISILIKMCTNIHEPIILNRINNSTIEVTI